MKLRATLGAFIAFICACSGNSFAGVIATWHFDEVSGPTAFDAVGSVDGTLMGDASFTAGGITGGAVQMSTSGNGFVDMGDNFSFAGSSTFSYSAWFKLNNGDTNGYIVAGRHQSTVVAGHLLGVNNINSGSGEQTGGAIFYQAYPNPVSGNLGLNDGGWHLLVGVHDAAGSGLTHLYVDGVLQSTVGHVGIPFSIANFAVGGILVGSNMQGSMTGLVDEVNVFDHALSQAEITDLFQNPGGNVVPEPASVGLFGSAGLIALAFRRRRSRAPTAV